MTSDLFDILIELPLYVIKLGQWMVEPLPMINVSPLELFTIAGVGAVTTIIIMHVIKLFI